jgi:hypothetical protein
VSGWTVTDPLIFFAAGGAVVAYILYMMVRKRRGERSTASKEIDL